MGQNDQKIREGCLITLDEMLLDSLFKDIRNQFLEGKGYLKT